jgi:mono/diheme cytochrome c family protein
MMVARRGRRQPQPVVAVFRGAVLLALAAGLAGCGASPGGATPDPVTFNRQIARLFQAQCQECHRPGSVAPFSLTTYREAYRWRHQILDAVRTRKMPPWKPVAGHGEFKNARRLADSEIALIARWVKAGAPEGDARELPTPREFHTRWRLGEPDLVLTPESSFAIPARQGDLYRCFVLPDTVREHRWVSATEVVPGNQKVVHHLVTFLDTTGLSAGLDLAEPGAGYTCFGGPRFESRGSLGSWAVGAGPLVMPPGVGMELPAGARVVMLIHYHNHGAAPATDRTAIGIHFAKGPIDKRVKDFSVHALNFAIPAGARRHEVKASDAVPAGSEWHAIAVVPHMHLLGREIRVTATYPDGTVRPLVYVADWDFNWQDFYHYAAPVPLPGGTRIDLSCIFDNSARNRRNPHSPPREVLPGERTTDEMCVVYFQITDDADLVDKGTPSPLPARLRADTASPPR